MTEMGSKKIKRGEKGVWRAFSTTIIRERDEGKEKEDKVVRQRRGAAEERFRIAFS